MDSLLHFFKEYINKEHLFQPNDILLLTVSGGVDSVVLCELCKQSGFKFILAHCNFQLRGEESERDELFVRKLSERYGAELLLKRFETNVYAKQKNISIQVAARELRYEWFNSIISSPPASGIPHPSYILTAHHADDNIETVLMNFFKGTGIAGMRGMLPKTGKIVRPLLFAKKQELIAFAREYNLSFVEDSSNISDKYSRNYVRNQVMPFMQKIYPEADHNITANIDRFKEVELLYTQALEVHKKRLIERRNSEVFIAVLKLLKTFPLKTVVFEIIKEYGFTPKQTEELIALLHAETGKYILSSSHRILRNRNWLIISPLPQSTGRIIVIGEGEKEVNFEKGKLAIQVREASEERKEMPGSPAVACLDIRQITFPLLLRKWKPGDYFYPLGMTKKKKLSRFFIDQKMSLAEKEGAWVVEMDKKIIWVVNKRIDDRVKVTGSTKVILQIHFSAITF